MKTRTFSVTNVFRNAHSLCYFELPSAPDFTEEGKSVEKSKLTAKELKQLQSDVQQDFDNGGNVVKQAMDRLEQAANYQAHLKVEKDAGVYKDMKWSKKKEKVSFLRDYTDTMMLQVVLAKIAKDSVIPQIHPGKMDGKWGKATKAAVMAFQQAAGISADGEFGTETFTTLKAVVDNTKSLEPALIKATAVKEKGAKREKGKSNKDKEAQLAENLTEKKDHVYEVTGNKVKVSFNDGTSKEFTFNFPNTPTTTPTIESGSDNDGDNFVVITVGNNKGSFEFDKDLSKGLILGLGEIDNAGNLWDVYQAEVKDTDVNITAKEVPGPKEIDKKDYEKQLDEQMENKSDYKYENGKLTVTSVDKKTTKTFDVTLPDGAKAELIGTNDGKMLKVVDRDGKAGFLFLSKDLTRAGTVTDGVNKNFWTELYDAKFDVKGSKIDVVARPKIEKPEYNLIGIDKLSVKFKGEANPTEFILKGLSDNTGFAMRGSMVRVMDADLQALGYFEFDENKNIKQVSASGMELGTTYKDLWKTCKATLKASPMTNASMIEIEKKQ